MVGWTMERRPMNDQPAYMSSGSDLDDEEAVEDEALALATRVTQRLRDSERLRPRVPADDPAQEAIDG